MSDSTSTNPPNPAADKRDWEYTDLQSQQLMQEAEQNRLSADAILSILFQSYMPHSVLDVGCGLATWLACAAKRGVPIIKGVDGPWLNPALLEIAPHLVQIRDLEQGFDLGERFDLVICLEVAEHLSEEAAARFIASLVRHAPAILFSAAIPFQGGHHHVNERFLPYWTKQFEPHGYRPIDLIRGKIWDHNQIHLWLRQNMVVFAREDLIMRNENFRRAFANQAGPLSVVHPQVYLNVLAIADRRAREVDGLLKALAEGGTFRSVPTPAG